MVGTIFVPFPVIYILYVVGGGIVGWIVGKTLEFLVDIFGDLFPSHKIAILGGRATGKTELSEFLKSGQVEDFNEYEQTFQRSSFDVPEGFFEQLKENLDMIDGVDTDSLADLEPWNIVTGNDVPGSERARSDWSKALENCNAVIYLASAPKLVDRADEDLKKRVIRDLEFIDSELEDQSIDPIRFFVLTKVDKSTDLSIDDPVEVIENHLLELDLISEIIVKGGGTSKWDVFQANLTDTEHVTLLSLILMIEFVS